MAETIVARHSGLPVLRLSLVASNAVPDTRPGEDDTLLEGARGAHRQVVCATFVSNSWLETCRIRPSKEDGHQASTLRPVVFSIKIFSSSWP